MAPKWTPKWTQNGPKMDPKMDPKWTPFYHIPLRDDDLPLINMLCFVRPGALFRILVDHDMAPKWTPKWTQNRAQNEPKIEPKIDPKWTPNGAQSGPRFIIFHCVNTQAFDPKGFVL